MEKKDDPPRKIKHIPKTPIRFGSEEDFYNAITEIKWAGTIGNELNSSEIDAVAIRYNFPPEFIKAGLEGLNYPDDLMIGKSKWYPIMYSWHKRMERILRDVEDAGASYATSRRDILFTFFLISYPVFAFLTSSSLRSLIPPTTVIISLGAVILPIILFLWRRNDRLSSKLDDEVKRAKSEGFGTDADEIRNLAIHKPLIARHLLRNEGGSVITAFMTGWVVMPTQKKKRSILDRIRRRKLGPEMVPLMEAEDPEVEYNKRLRNLLDVDKK